MRETPAVAVVSTFATPSISACGSSPSAPSSDLYATFQLQLVGGLPIPCISPLASALGHRVLAVSGSLTLSPDGSFQRTEVREREQSNGYGAGSTWTEDWVQRGTFEIEGHASSRKLSGISSTGLGFFEASVTEEGVLLDDRMRFGIFGETVGGIYYYVRHGEAD
jgi:hypothetical protein